MSTYSNVCSYVWTTCNEIILHEKIIHMKSILIEIIDEELFSQHRRKCTNVDRHTFVFLTFHIVLVVVELFHYKRFHLLSNAFRGEGGQRFYKNLNIGNFSSRKICLKSQFLALRNK